MDVLLGQDRKLVVNIKSGTPQETAIISAGELRISVGMGMFLMVVGWEKYWSAQILLLFLFSRPSPHKAMWKALGCY